MSPASWVSLVALLGWLALMVGALRGRGMERKRMLVMLLAWSGIFLFVAAIFSLLGSR